MNHYLTPYTKIYSKLITVLNIRPEIMKLLEETIGDKLLDIGLGSHFFDSKSKGKKKTPKINNWDYTKSSLLLAVALHASLSV